MWNSSQAERGHDVTGRCGVVATGVVRFRSWTPIFSASYESARRLPEALVTIQ
jgi:hypothetical protein